MVSYFILIPKQYKLLFRVHWKPGGMNFDDEYHEAYLNKFKNTNLFKLQTLIKKSLEDDPELKSRKKIVEVSVYLLSIRYWY